MRRPLDAAPSARLILLGLLLDGARHGYAMVRAVGPDSTVGKVIHLTPSHLYALLTRLEQDGLVHVEQEDAGARPPRHVYSLTQAGRVAVLRWASSPVERPRDMLIDFPLRLYVAARQGRAQALALIEAQRAVFDAYIAQLEISAPAPPTDARDSANGDESVPPELYALLVNEARLERVRSSLRWLDYCRAALTSSPVEPTRTRRA